MVLLSRRQHPMPQSLQFTQRGRLKVSSLFLYMERAKEV